MIQFIFIATIHNKTYLKAPHTQSKHDQKYKAIKYSLIHSIYSTVYIFCFIYNPINSTWVEIQNPCYSNVLRKKMPAPGNGGDILLPIKKIQHPAEPQPGSSMMAVCIDLLGVWDDRKERERLTRTERLIQEYLTETQKTTMLIVECMKNIYLQKQ